jgi:hypothetical protein
MGARCENEAMETAAGWKQPMTCTNRAGPRFFGWHLCTSCLFMLMVVFRLAKVNKRKLVVPYKGEGKKGDKK